LDSKYQRSPRNSWRRTLTCANKLGRRFATRHHKGLDKLDIDAGGTADDKDESVAVDSAMVEALRSYETRPG
jgi:hypothetical protein